MKRVLYITSFSPYPPGSGGAILIDLMIRKLSERCSLDLALFEEAELSGVYDRVLSFRRFGTRRFHKAFSLLTDRPGNFARSACSLLKDREKGERMARANRQYLQARERELDAVLDRLLEN